MPQLPLSFLDPPAVYTQRGDSIIPRTETGESLKAAGCAQVLSAERDSWLRIAHAALRAFAATTYPRSFTIEELRASFAGAYLNAPHSPNVWGALTRQAIAKGTVRHVGYVRAKSKKTHAHPVGVYVWIPTEPGKNDRLANARPTGKRQ